MVIVGNSFALILREGDIVISAYDMNVILITIESHPAVKKAATSLPLCLPGISDEGFLYLTIKYATPLIGIVYVSLANEDFFNCLEKANELSAIFEKEEIYTQITKCYNEFYIEKIPIVPNRIFSSIF